MFRRLSSFLLLCALLLTFSSCNKPATHPLIGAWQAEDKTIFIFREDRTFHGVDYRGKEIWGNWAKLSETRIGFQSLLYDSYYNPQYAIIRKGDPSQMDYIATGYVCFLAAKRIDVSKAEAAVEMMVEPNVHLPVQPPTTLPSTINPAR